MKRYAITTGDANGIGFEVSVKALSRLGPIKNVQFVVYRGPNSETKYYKLLNKKFNVISINSESEIERVSLKKNILIDLVQETPPPFWVKSAAEHCLDKTYSGLITAPLSKELIRKCGFEYAKGHTEILKKVSGSQDLNMVFIGKYFNVLLATGHIPIQQVSSSLASGQLSKALDHAILLRKHFPLSLKKKPIAVLGFNPHAGEGGLLGKEELEIFNPLLSQYSNKDVVGPLPPDIAFKKENWSKYSVFLCPYHDQGLIPFKLVHGTDSGYHLTFGLPFVRTSVDHGTAFDIFGKNKANPSSMLDAIKACLALTK